MKGFFEAHVQFGVTRKSTVYKETTSFSFTTFTTTFNYENIVLFKFKFAGTL